jgi:alginate O-acetyltransferase complex protein AlgI
MLAFERSQGKEAPYNRLPRPIRVALTFLIVVFAWVFFRARDLPTALAYCQSMLGFGAPQPGAGLIAGLVYQPYYLLSVIMAAVVTWAGVQTWDWTRSITWPKGATIFALFWVSLLVMATQAYNPFIYFIF